MVETRLLLVVAGRTEVNPAGTMAVSEAGASFRDPESALRD